IDRADRQGCAGGDTRVFRSRENARRQGKIRHMRQKLRFGVVYDFRNPPESGMSNPALYAAIMEQVVWLDSLGLDLVWFTEHHFVDDGYLPSWVPVAAAIAARTKHVRFSCAVWLLPF